MSSSDRADPKAPETHPLFEQMERLSNELCQTQAFILRALQRAGLTVVSEADRKVLEAMAKLPPALFEKRNARACPELNAAIQAELARRSGT